MSSDQYQNHINNLMMKYKPLVEKVHDGSDVSSYLYQNLIPHQSAIRPHQGYDYYAYKNPWENMQLPYHIPVENHPLEDGLKGTTTEVTTEAKPDFLEAKPEIVEAKLEAAEAKPLVEAKTEFVEAKPEFLEAKPELLEAKPEPLEAKPELFEAKPELLGAKPEHFKESSEAVASPNLLKENLQGTIVGAEQASKQPKTEAINDKLGDKVNKSKDTGKSSEKIKEGLKPDLGVKSPWGEAPSKIPMQHHRSGDLLTSDPNPILQAYRQLNLLVPAALQIKALQDQLKEVKQQSALQIASLESKNKSVSKIFSKEGDFFTSSPNKAIFSVNPFEKLTSEAGLVSPALIQEFVAQAKNLEPPSKSYEINDQTDGIKSALETSSSSGNKEHELPKNTNLIQPSNNQKVEILKILNLATKQQSKENERKEDTLKSTNEKSNAQSATEQLKLLMLMRNLQAKGATEKEHLNSIVSQIASNRLSDSGTATLPSYNSDINSMLLKMVLKDQNPVLSSLKSEPRYKETQLLHMNDGSLAEVFEKEKSKNNAKQNESEIIRLLVEKLQHKKHKKTKDILENPYAKIGYVGKREPLLSQPSDSNNHDTSSSSVSSFNRILQSITSHFNDDAVKETREQVNVKKSINKQRKKNSLEKIFKNKKSNEEE